MNKKVTTTLFLLIIILIFSACSGEGIFYTIQNEVKIIDKGLPNAKFLDVHNTNTGGSTGYYIARGVNLWYRSKSLTSAWTKIDMPSGADAIQSSAMYTPATPANIAFYYTVKSGDNASLYRVDNVDSSIPGAGSNIITISPATNGNYMMLQLYSNEDSGQNRLFMNAVEYNKDGPVSSVLYFYGTDGKLSILGDMTLCTTTLSNKPIRTKGIAFGSGGNTWLIYNDDSSGTAGGHLYFSSNNFTGVNTAVSAGSGFYEAIYGRTIGTDLVMVSAKTDTNTYKLFSNANASGAGTWASTDTGTAYLSCFAWADSLVTNYIVAGAKSSSSNSKGIYLINSASLSVAADGETLADSANYLSSDLRNSSIYGIMVDENADAAAGTAVLTATSKDTNNGGVWFLNGTSRIWNHE